MSADQEVQLAMLEDEHGVIRVVEKGEYRFLEFGDEVEQSCVYLAEPHWLEYDYARAMLLGGVCHPAPRRALFLGLGAGSLTQACLRYLPLESVEVVELRESVPGLARTFLGLADDSRMSIHIGDAVSLLEDCQPADLIFVDLYTDHGPAAAHLGWDFLRRCREQLTPGGWLVINQWQTDNGKPLGAALLRGAFHRHYWECPVPEGNVILWVPQSLDDSLDLAGLRQRLALLEPELGYSMMSYLEWLRPAS